MAIKDKKKKKEKVIRDNSEAIEQLCFNFSKITSNHSFGIEYFGPKQLREKEVMLSNLMEKLRYLSGKSFAEVARERKDNGMEQIPYSQLSESVQGICDHSRIVTKDSKVTIFRFCGDKYRLICKTGINNNNLMYVLCFDFCFKAYNHG